jgi:hypothetical protein
MAMGDHNISLHSSFCIVSFFICSHSRKEGAQLAELFKKQTATLIPDYDRDCVKNTDQTGCE